MGRWSPAWTPAYTGADDAVPSGVTLSARLHVESLCQLFSDEARPMRGLLQYFDGRSYKSLVVGDEPVFIGGRTAAIRVPGSTVTRKHARIYREADDHWIEDLGGDGVWVNGAKTESCKLTNRDQLRVGELSLEYFEH